MLADFCRDVNRLNLADIPEPRFLLGDLIEQTFTYKENQVTVIEVAQIVGICFNPTQNIWEYVPYWLTSTDPEDVRPCFDQDSLSFYDFEDEEVIINIRKLP